MKLQINTTNESKSNFVGRGLESLPLNEFLNSLSEATAAALNGFVDDKSTGFTYFGNKNLAEYITYLEGIFTKPLEESNGFAVIGDSAIPPQVKDKLEELKKLPNQESNAFFKQFILQFNSIRAVKSGYYSADKVRDYNTNPKEWKGHSTDTAEQKIFGELKLDIREVQGKRGNQEDAFTAEELTEIKDPVLFLQNVTRGAAEAVKERSSGSCALSCLTQIENNKVTITISNIADSRAILVAVPKDGSKPKAVRLSMDQKPNDIFEIARIKKNGGFVSFSDAARLNGQLAVPRAVGDINIGAGLTSESDILQYSFELDDKNDYFFVNGCDGLFDRTQDWQIAEMVKAHKNTENISTKLVDGALSDGSMDNITAFCLKLVPTNITIFMGIYDGHGGSACAIAFKKAIDTQLPKKTKVEEVKPKVEEVKPTVVEKSHNPLQPSHPELVSGSLDLGSLDSDNPPQTSHPVNLPASGKLEGRSEVSRSQDLTSTPLRRSPSVKTNLHNLEENIPQKKEPAPEKKSSYLSLGLGVLILGLAVAAAVAFNIGLAPVIGATLLAATLVTACVGLVVHYRSNDDGGYTPPASQQSSDNSNQGKTHSQGMGRSTGRDNSVPVGNPSASQVKDTEKQK